MLSKKIALVEDDSEYADLLAQYIRGLGAEVDVFSDSNDLLAQGDPYGYDFYVVDLILPGVDGVDRQFSAEPGTRARPLRNGGWIGARASWWHRTAYALA